MAAAPWYISQNKVGMAVADNEIMLATSQDAISITFGLNFSSLRASVSILELSRGDTTARRVNKHGLRWRAIFAC
jgi:hypothetical protein